MRESDTFMAIIDEGRETEARRIIRLLAKRRLGEPDEPTQTRLEGITDIDRLERIIERLERIIEGVEQAPSWDELLGTP